MTASSSAPPPKNTLDKGIRASSPPVATKRQAGKVLRPAPAAIRSEGNKLLTAAARATRRSASPRRRARNEPNGEQQKSSRGARRSSAETRRRSPPPSSSPIAADRHVATSACNGGGVGKVDVLVVAAAASAENRQVKGAAAAKILSDDQRKRRTVGGDDSMVVVPVRGKGTADGSQEMKLRQSSGVGRRRKAATGGGCRRAGRDIEGGKGDDRLGIDKREGLEESAVTEIKRSNLRAANIVAHSAAGRRQVKAATASPVFTTRKEELPMASAATTLPNEATRTSNRRLHATSPVLKLYTSATTEVKKIPSSSLKSTRTHSPPGPLSQSSASKHSVAPVICSPKRKQQQDDGPLKSTEFTRQPSGRKLIVVDCTTTKAPLSHRKQQKQTAADTHAPLNLPPLPAGAAVVVSPVAAASRPIAPTTTARGGGRGGRKKTTDHQIPSLSSAGNVDSAASTATTTTTTIATTGANVTKTGGRRSPRPGSPAKAFAASRGIAAGGPLPLRRPFNLRLRGLPQTTTPDLSPRRLMETPKATRRPSPRRVTALRKANTLEGSTLLKLGTARGGRGFPPASARVANVLSHRVRTTQLRDEPRRIAADLLHRKGSASGADRAAGSSWLQRREGAGKSPPQRRSTTEVLLTSAAGRSWSPAPTSTRMPKASEGGRPGWATAIVKENVGSAHHQQTKTERLEGASGASTSSSPTTAVKSICMTQERGVESKAPKSKTINSVRHDEFLAKPMVKTLVQRVGMRESQRRCRSASPELLFRRGPTAAAAGSRTKRDAAVQKTFRGRRAGAVRNEMSPPVSLSSDRKRGVDRTALPRLSSPLCIRDGKNAGRKSATGARGNGKSDGAALPKTVVASASSSPRLAATTPKLKKVATVDHSLIARRSSSSRLVLRRHHTLPELSMTKITSFSREPPYSTGCCQRCSAGTTSASSRTRRGNAVICHSARCIRRLAQQGMSGPLSMAEAGKPITCCRCWERRSSFTVHDGPTATNIATSTTSPGRPGNASRCLARRTHAAKSRDTGRVPVYLHVHDLSGGKAALWSRLVLGRQIQGIWHTAVQVHGDLFQFLGGEIVQTRYHGQEEEAEFLGPPIRVHNLGCTSVSKLELAQHLLQLTSQFAADTYDISKRNCNHFTNHLSLFLLGREIPRYIVALPEVVRSVPFGRVAVDLISRYHNNPLVKMSLSLGGEESSIDPATVTTTTSGSSSKSSDGPPIGLKRNRVSEAGVKKNGAAR